MASHHSRCSVLPGASSVSHSVFKVWCAGGTPECKQPTDVLALVLIRTVHWDVQ